MSSFSRLRQEDLVQRLSEFYLAQLGHPPGQVDCQLSDSQIVITIDGALTQLEKLLSANSQTSLVQNLRASLDQVLQSKLRAWIAELVEAEVIDLCLNTDITQNRMMAIVILADSPDTEASDRSKKM